MARPREFDVDNALERAMQVFWAKGYEAASLEDLCGATGLGRSSLYAAFTDKRQLYIDALRHYQDRAVARVEKALDGSAPIRRQLARFLDDTVASIVSGTGRRGCLIGNAAAEVPHDDPEVAQIVRDGIQKHEDVFAAALQRAQERREIAASKDVRSLARFIVASFHGLRLVGKARQDRAALTDVASYIVRCLD
jgi:TetR/AcrR family transcriptional repressor of nem operon